jgi:hypothetical protein
MVLFQNIVRISIAGTNRKSFNESLLASGRFKCLPEDRPLCAAKPQSHSGKMGCRKTDWSFLAISAKLNLNILKVNNYFYGFPVRSD